jgi:hypothetical protein
MDYPRRVALYLVSMKTDLPSISIILLLLISAIFTRLVFLLNDGLATQEDMLALQEATLVLSVPIMLMTTKWDSRKERRGDERKIHWERVMVFLMWAALIFVSYIYLKPSKLERAEWTQIVLGKGVSIAENDVKFMSIVIGCCIILTNFGRNEIDTSNPYRVMWIIPALLMLSAIMIVFSNNFLYTIIFGIVFQLYMFAISIGISSMIFGIGREKDNRLPHPIIEVV